MIQNSTNLYTDITGIILSGGKSIRMGSDKAMLEIGGQKIIQIIVEVLKKIFSEVILITNHPEGYKFIGIRVFEDIFPGMGPLGGLHSGLVNSGNYRNFIISCDLPLVSELMVRYMYNYNSKKEIVIAQAEGYNQQLFGIYTKKLHSCYRNNPEK